MEKTPRQACSLYWRRTRNENWWSMFQFEYTARCSWRRLLIVLVRMKQNVIALYSVLACTHRPVLREQTLWREFPKRNTNRATRFLTVKEWARWNIRHSLVIAVDKSCGDLRTLVYVWLWDENTRNAKEIDLSVPVLPTQLDPLSSSEQCCDIVEFCFLNPIMRHRA